MSTFRARVQIDDGTLHTSRPLTAPEQVRDMIESVVYSMSESTTAGEVLSVELEFETVGESDSPIGDSIAGTSSTPLAVPLDDDDEVDAPTLAGQQ